MAAWGALALPGKLSQGGEELHSACPGNEALQSQAQTGTGSLLSVRTAGGRGGVREGVLGGGPQGAMGVPAQTAWGKKGPGALGTCREAGLRPSLGRIGQCSGCCFWESLHFYLLPALPEGA